MVPYQGEKESVHVHTGEERVDHEIKEEESQRKERAYINDIVRRYNDGDEKGARGILRDYKKNYPRSNIWTASQRDHIVSQLEHVIDSDEAFTVEITGESITVTPKQEGVVVRPKPDKPMQ